MATTTTIDKCRSCGEEHQDISFHKLTNPTPPFTHCYVCPETADPVMLAIYEYEGETRRLANDVLDMLTRAFASKSYVVAVWHHDRVTTITRLWKDFPTSEFPTCVAQLQSEFEKETGPPPQRRIEPAVVPQGVNLFGD